MLLRTKQSVIAVEKTLKYQLNESYAEGFNDAREHIANLIKQRCVCEKGKEEWCSYCHASRIARNLN